MFNPVDSSFHSPASRGRRSRRAIGVLLALMTVTRAYGLDQSDGRRLRRTPVVEAYERVRDSVVNISATETVATRRWGMNLFGEILAVPGQRQLRSVGSGFVIHGHGYIATNAHVVSAGTELTVTFADGSEFEASVIGHDTIRDLAVIKIEPGHPVDPIPLGSSRDLMIGEQTIAVGNPVGLQNTVTVGVVSALHRKIEFDGRVVYHDLIQTDASINPGNSGGPLLNVLGELIGINTAIRGDAQNIGFAIPVDQLRELLPAILDCEKLKKVKVGLTLSASDPARVVAVQTGSPAAQAGIQTGDVLARIDGERVTRSVDFHVAMLEHNAGDVVTLGVRRGNHELERKLTIQSLPVPDGRELARRHLGTIIANPRDQVSRRFGRGGRNGVVVITVEPNSPADRAGIRPGDLLLTMGRYWVRNVDNVGLLLSRIQPGDPVDIGFRRVYRNRLLEDEVRLFAQ